eukprot:TRINITY_DN2712_c0_g1_i2.p1 TRINITY_DN2712_c0_g1~~TRINITY_DN2712_c0_g1_i2.p1  ORF type:complete len:416 (-),score=98.65 TRINITY_DN2712_c0_g1_i2:428-1675(-)
MDQTISQSRDYRSGVVIIPKFQEGVYDVLNQVRKGHDIFYGQWRFVNVKVLYPFVSLNGVLESVRESLLPFSEFRVVFDQFEIKEVSSGYRLSLLPDDDSLMRNLRESMIEYFPECDDLSLAGFHITLGHFDSREECKDIIEEIQSKVDNFEAVIENIDILWSDSEHDPYTSKYQVDLGGPISVSVPDTPSSIQSFNKMPVYKFEDSEWKETAIPSENIDVESLKVITWNILFDIYDKELIHTEERYPRILELLSSIDADIIGLEEVTQKFLVMILREKWVQENYYVSESFQYGTTIKPYGQLLLSKIPYSLHVHRYSEHKKAIVGEYKINSRTLYLPLIHLTSNSGNNRTNQRRAYQLGVIYDRLCPELDIGYDTLTDVLIMGDFNISYNVEGEDIVLLQDLLDVWKVLYLACA